MTTKLFKDWLKSVVETPSITTGKLDTTKEQTICVYGGLSSTSAINTVGGHSGYYPKHIRIIVRWTTNSSDAETKANEVYSAVGNVNTTIAGKSVCILPLHSEPVALGTDDKGVYEYAIELKLFCER